MQSTKIGIVGGTICHYANLSPRELLRLGERYGLSFTTPPLAPLRFNMLNAILNHYEYNIIR